MAATADPFRDHEQKRMTIEGLTLLAAAGDSGVWNVLWDILVLLSMALLLGTIAERLGQSAIVGYLIAGTLVGPNVLGYIASQEQIFGIAELGVALLLFAIGLEFSPQRLMSLGSIVLKAGPLQVTLTTAIGFGAAVACGLDPRQSLVVGMMVAVSSTACVLRLLTDRTEVDSEHGRTSLGILLVQDAAVIPMMLLVSVMATGGSWGIIVGKLALALVSALGLIGLFYVLFNIVAPRLLLLPTWRRNRDLPVLLAVIMATGSAWATHAIGLSPALGAFVAGVLLAVSPFAAQIRADTRPLTTLMVTLFFAAIGMFGDPAWLLSHAALVAGIVVAIVIGKAAVIISLVRFFGRPWRFAVAAGLCLAQVGEFSFVLATIAQSSATGEALMSPGTFRAMVSATIVTLLVTPYLVTFAPQIGIRVERLFSRRKQAIPTSGETSDAATAAAGHGSRGDLILIIGFGPAGQRVAEGLLEADQERLVAVDLNPENIAVAQRYQIMAHLGDASHRDILEHAGVFQAKVVVITVPDPTSVRGLIHLIRDIAPHVYIVTRCRYHLLHWELLRAGAHEVVDEEDQLGLRLAEEVKKLAPAAAEA